MSTDQKAAIRATYAAAARGESQPCCGVPLPDVVVADDRSAGIAAAAARAPGAGVVADAADMQVGETVVDLGCGCGVEALIAARRVGPRGRVWGVDMAEEMLALARRHALASDAHNIAFMRADVEDLPLPAASVDAAIGNCIFNLALDMSRAVDEVARILKPAGRLVVAEPLADAPGRRGARDAPGQWTTCNPGTLCEQEWGDVLVRAGFDAIEVSRRGGIGPHDPAVAIIRARNGP